MRSTRPLAWGERSKICRIPNSCRPRVNWVASAMATRRKPASCPTWFGRWCSGGIKQHARVRIIINDAVIYREP